MSRAENDIRIAAETLLTGSEVHNNNPINDTMCSHQRAPADIVLSEDILAGAR